MKERIEKVRTGFDKYGIDGFVTTNEIHIRYLSGLATPGYFFVSADKAILVTDFRYQETARGLSEKYGSYIVIIPEYAKLLEPLIELANDKNKIGFDPKTDYSVFAAFERRLANKLTAADIIDKVSQIKDAEEIGHIKKALGITERIFAEHILPLVKPGVTERELAAMITYQHLLHGAEDNSFSPIVISGINSSLPHGKPSDKKLEKGDVLQFDFGCVVNGYCSDFSRVVVVGKKPTEKQKKMYDIVLTAQKKAITAARPGMKCKDLDAVARNHIAKMGYGDKFGHNLGHGVGIEIHVPPSVGPLSPDDAVLLPGHVLTIEPGIYIPGWGGMRLEDMLLVTEKGAENLTKYPKKLIGIG